MCHGYRYSDGKDEKVQMNGETILTAKYSMLLKDVF